MASNESKISKPEPCSLPNKHRNTVRPELLTSSSARSCSICMSTKGWIITEHISSWCIYVVNSQKSYIKELIRAKTIVYLNLENAGKFTVRSTGILLGTGWVAPSRDPFNLSWNITEILGLCVCREVENGGPPKRLVVLPKGAWGRWVCMTRFLASLLTVGLNKFEGIRGLLYRSIGELLGRWTDE